MKIDSDIYKEEEREEDKIEEKEIKIIIIVIISINQYTVCPKKQRNRDKNKTKKNQPESDKTLVKITLDISQEIVDQIEVGKCCKICYINDTPPLIRIRREGKEDIITHKFSIGKSYKESVEANTTNTKDKAYDLIHIEDENHPTLGDPNECGSYWTKCPTEKSTLDLSKEKLLLKQKLLQEMAITTVQKKVSLENYVKSVKVLMLMD